MKTMQMIALLLVMLLLPGCDKEQQTKQVKEPSPEPGLEICDSSYEEMNKKNEEMIKKIEAIIGVGHDPFSDAEFEKMFDAAEKEERRKLWDAIDKAKYNVRIEKHGKMLEAKYEEVFKKPAPQWKNNSFWSKIPKAMEDMKTKIKKRGKSVECLRSNNCAYYILDKEYDIRWKESSR